MDYTNVIHSLPLIFQSNIIMLRPSSISKVARRQLISFCSVLSMAHDLYLKLKHSVYS